MSEEYMTTEEIADALGVSLPRRSAPAMTVFILQGEHFHVPGIVMSAHATMENATIAAAELVNDLFQWIEQPQDAKPATWEADLLRARKARAENMGTDPNDLETLGAEDDADVWITELEVQS